MKLNAMTTNDGVINGVAQWRIDNGNDGDNVTGSIQWRNGNDIRQM